MMPTHKDTSSIFKAQSVGIIQSNNSARYSDASHSPTSISSSGMSTSSPNRLLSLHPNHAMVISLRCSIAGIRNCVSVIHRNQYQNAAFVVMK